MKEFFASSLGCTFAIFFFGFGLFQLWAGARGITLEWGWGWGFAAIIAAITFRFTIPIVVGCYLYATTVWEWNWFFSALFAAPGLIFMIPSLLADMFAGSRSRL